MREPVFLPAWLTLTDFPAMVTLVERAPPRLFGTATEDVPLPEPDPLTVAHDVDAELHAQPLAVVTVTARAPAAAVKLSEVGETE